jgi:two-component system, OmpR family, response regulator
MTYTICLVDDNKDILDVFSIFFEKMGYNIVEATGGQECIDIIHTRPPDIILLDVMMEPMDGWNTLERIKSNPETVDIPVIMVSGRRPTMEEWSVYGKLFTKYVMKPVSFPVLCESVTKVLEKRARVKM